MNKSQTIYFNTTKSGVNMNIKVRLEQDIDTLEFMSMQLSTEEIYQDFNSDYGVLVGRVTANGGVGIPNAKISIFIPLSDADADMGQITSIYPYKTPRDKNFEGKRYNLLPRVSKIDPNTNQLVPKQAFGSFPIKEEVVTNTLIMDVYKKYYKYTALTNNSGDYMIFGVPIGTQTVHMSVDITDIGEYSMNPAAMVTNLGYSPNLFTDNNTRIKPSADLGDLPNIETQEISVDVIPFWGDTTNFEIGITRQDFRIRATLVNTFTIFGSIFTDGSNNMWGGNIDSNTIDASVLYRAYDGNNDDTWATIGISSRRIGKVSEKIYYYPANVTDNDIDAGNVDSNGADMIILDPSEYTVHKRDGDFVFIINCNRSKITKDENGNVISISADSPDGVFTEFRGFITLEITPDDLPMNFEGQIGKGNNKASLKPYRYKLKFPQHAKSGKGFGYPLTPTEEAETNSWRKQNYKFSAGKFYSFSRHHGLTENSNDNNDDQDINIYGFLEPDKVNMISYGGINTFKNVGIIQTNTTASSNNYPNAIYEFPSNALWDGDIQYFGSNWLNLSIYLPQAGYADNGYAYLGYINTNDNFSEQDSAGSESIRNGYYLVDNQQIIAAGDFNTKWFARSDLHWTDIIEVPVNDIRKMGEMPTKGFIYDPETQNTLTGQYRNGNYVPQGWEGACPVADGEALSNGGRLNADPNQPPDPKVYFYRGLGDADCIQYLYELGLIN
jgi:hypothetical protein